MEFTFGLWASEQNGMEDGASEEYQWFYVTSLLGNVVWMFRHSFPHSSYLVSDWARNAIAAHHLLSWDFFQVRKVPMTGKTWKYLVIKDNWQCALATDPNVCTFFSNQTMYWVCPLHVQTNRIIIRYFVLHRNGFLISSMVALLYFDTMPKC